MQKAVEKDKIKMKSRIQSVTQNNAKKGVLTIKGEVN
jgi:hypothetical protein